MGDCLQSWRARIGTFCVKCKNKCNPSIPIYCDGLKKSRYFISIILITILLIIGGLELNPGPVTNEDLQKLIKDRFKKLDKNVRKVSKNLKETRKELKTMKVVVKQNRDEIDQLKRTNMELKTQLEAVDCRGRLKNLVFSGLNVSDNINDSVLVCDLIKTKLEIDVSSDDLEKCTRLPNYKTKSSIVIVSFVSQLFRDCVLKAASKLKGSNVYVNADLPLETRKKQSELRQLSRKARECGYKDVKIRKTGLLLDGVFYMLSKLPQLLGNQHNNDVTTPPNVPDSPASSLDDTKSSDDSSSAEEEEEAMGVAGGGVTQLIEEQQAPRDLRSAKKVSFAFETPKRKTKN